MAHCPNCEQPLDLKAQRCDACKAEFTAIGGWRPIPATPAEAAEFKALHPGQQPGRLARRRESLWTYFFSFVGILGAGSMYGVFAHAFFGKFFSQAAEGRSGLMMASFLIGVPAVIAVIWGVLLSRRRKAGLAGTAAGSSLPIILFIFLAGAFLREGFLCVLMATPLFIAVGVVGSILGWLLDKVAGDKSPKLLSVALVAPFLLATGEERMPPPDAVRQVTATIHIQAPPARVWKDINFPTDIRREELAGGWAYRMGVPYPLEARTLEPRVGGLRELRWERGVRFQEEITRYDEGRSIAWRYRFTPESFPPGSLDDHVVIGGRYFDLLDTGYDLVPEGGGTRLTIHVGYRVTTNFNWYAERWASFLIEDTAAVILRFYKRRGESEGQAARDSRGS